MNLFPGRPPVSPAYVGLLALIVNLWAVALANDAFSGIGPGDGSGAGSAPVRIVAYGDSLTAGFGMAESSAFPVQLEAALRKRGHAVEVANAGVSGDTTGSGLERFDWAVPDGTDAVILELGANDALRGLDPKIARRNLEAIIDKLEAKGIDILLAGMAAPRNLGSEYVAAFDGMYSDLAQKHGLLHYPFFLDGVAQKPDLNLSDGLHPNEKGVAVIVERIVPKVEELIARVTARRASPKL